MPFGWRGSCFLVLISLAWVGTGAPVIIPDIDAFLPDRWAQAALPASETAAASA